MVGGEVRWGEENSPAWLYSLFPADSASDGFTCSWCNGWSQDGTSSASQQIRLYQRCRLDWRRQKTRESEPVGEMMWEELERERNVWDEAVSQTEDVHLLQRLIGRQGCRSSVCDQLSLKQTHTCEESSYDHSGWHSDPQRLTILQPTEPLHYPEVTDSLFVELCPSLH